MRSIRIILSLAGLIIFGISSWMMWNRPLWGYLPLWQFLGLFCMVSFSFRKWLFNNSSRVRWVLMSLSSGLLFALGFPPSPVFIGLALGMVPLLSIEREILSVYQRPRPWLLWKYLFTAFWLWNIISTFWVANTAFVAGLIANIANAALMTLPWIVFHLWTWKTTSWWRYALMACLWVMFEYLHHHWDISWPWLTLGNGMATAYKLIQWYQFTGVVGGTLWLWALNILAFYILYGPARGKQHIFTATGLTLFIPGVFSVVLYLTYKEKGAPVRTSIVQPNYEPHFQKFSVPEDVQEAKIVRMTAQGIDNNTQLIVYPETVFDPVNLDSPYVLNRSIQRLHTLFTIAPNAYILAGVGGFHTFSEDPGRSTVRNQDRIYYELYNAAIMFGKDSSKVQEYFKSKFVPGAELFPFKKLLPFLKPIVRKLGGTYEGFAAQDTPSVLVFNGKKVAPIICYESVYGAWVAGYVRRGAGVLAIVTNDGWWDNTQGHVQHLHLGRLRAIENRKDIVRSANTGTSCFINQRGDLSQQTGYETDAVIRGNAMYHTGQTFYSRHGDYLVLVTAIFGVFLFVLTGYQRWRKDV